MFPNVTLSLLGYILSVDSGFWHITYQGQSIPVTKILVEPENI